MAINKGLTGVNNVMRNLNKELDEIGGKSMKGLIRAAILIRRDMDKTPPVIPVDLGNLRASGFVVTALGAIDSNPTFTGPKSAELTADHTSEIAKQKSIVTGKKIVAIGFSASYASIVEGDTVTERKRPGSGGAFFKSAILRNKALVVKVIKKDAKIK